MTRIVTLTVALAAAGWVRAFAQAPAAAPAQKPPQPPPAAASPAPPETYSYQPEGRRDPFLSLLGAGSDARSARTGGGLGSLHAADISVSGVLQSQGEMVAMIKGPDNKTYIVRQGEKFADGTIKSITPAGLVIIQDVNDPLSLVKQREIRKLLRSLEDAKE